LDKARILLADDHPEFLAMTVRLLQGEFHVLKTLGDAQAVVDEAAALNPDLVVLDISMPGLNGIEAALRLRASGSNAKVVFLTVHRDPDYLQSALAVGALGYVVKDRLASDLVPALHEALAGRQFISGSLPVAGHATDSRTPR
jgi:DNA-binding NarL/FixJ family response regulator